MFYGNSGISTDQSTTAIWTDAGYDGVWHLHDDFLDASGTANNGTNNGSSDISPANNSGDGQSFTDPNHWIELTNHPTRTSDFSYTAWARTSNRSIAGQRVICDDASNGSGCHAISIGDPGAGRVRFYIRGLGPVSLDSPGGTIINNTWHHIAATFNDGTNLKSLYVDGVLVNSVSVSNNSLGPANGNASIGGEVASGESGNRFMGDIDEVRAANTVLSAAWIATEYNNQNSPSTFYSTSAEMTANLLCVTLPIELLKFDAIAIDNDYIKLDWITASELNNDYFTVERSVDGNNWETISTIKGAANSSVNLDYSTNDNAPLTGLSYYRLKQTDFDGQFEYSNTRSVTIKTYENEELHIYPNPTENSVTISGNQLNVDDIIIINCLGQDVTRLTSIDKQGEEVLQIDLSLLSSGVYLIKTPTTINKVYKY